VEKLGSYIFHLSSPNIEGGLKSVAKSENVVIHSVFKSIEEEFFW
jgi:hypothetical protein